MAQYRKKLEVIEATRWFKAGDHSEVGRLPPHMDPGERFCDYCSRPMSAHGAIATEDGPHVVHPGDWLIGEEKGKRYPCKPEIFAATYEAVEPVDDESF